VASVESRSAGENGASLGESGRGIAVGFDISEVFFVDAMLK
jgi:hypothetical protein